MFKGENMDYLAALHTLYLRFTFGKNSMHASPHAYRILIFFSAFFSKFMLSEFRAKDAAVIVDHTQIA